MKTKDAEYITTARKGSSTIDTATETLSWKDWLDRMARRLNAASRVWKRVWVEEIDIGEFALVGERGALGQQILKGYEKDQR